MKKQLQLSIKVLLSLVLIIMSGTAFGQYKCKLVKNETDPFTGSKVRVTDHVANHKDAFKSTSLRLTQNGDAFTLYLAMDFISEATQKTFSIKEGQVLMFLLDNKDTVMLHAQATIKGTVDNTSKRALQSVNNDYPITSDQLEKLNNSPVKQFRVFVVRPDAKDYGIDCEPNKKLAGVLMQMITCVKSAL